MSLLWRGPWLGGQLTLVGGPGLRDEAEGCGGVEAAGHQPLGLECHIGVLCEAHTGGFLWWWRKTGPTSRILLGTWAKINSSLNMCLCNVYDVLG